MASSNGTTTLKPNKENKFTQYLHSYVRYNDLKNFHGLYFSFHQRFINTYNNTVVLKYHRDRRELGTFNTVTWKKAFQPTHSTSLGEGSGCQAVQGIHVP